MYFLRLGSNPVPDSETPSMSSLPCGRARNSPLSRRRVADQLALLRGVDEDQAIVVQRGAGPEIHGSTEFLEVHQLHLVADMVLADGLEADDGPRRQPQLDAEDHVVLDERDEGTEPRRGHDRGDLDCLRLRFLWRLGTCPDLCACLHRHDRRFKLQIKSMSITPINNVGVPAFQGASRAKKYVFRKILKFEEKNVHL